MGVSLDEFQKALNALAEAYDFLKQTQEKKAYSIARDACIQRLEFSVELAWKVAGKKLGSSSTTAKPVIREMAQNQLIVSTERWFSFIEARNKSSHTYNEELAEQVLLVVPDFLAEAEELIKRLEKI